jgi:SAM-dependent methyltransferase
MNTTSVCFGQRILEGNLERSSVVASIEEMPRAGFGASWLDRKLTTGRPEYIDLADGGQKKQIVLQTMAQMGRVFQYNNKNAVAACEVLTGVRSPRVLELGAAHGGLSQRLLEFRPDASITVTDIDPDFVAHMNTSELGADDRVTVRMEDARQIQAGDQEFDLAVFALSFHHLLPADAAAVLYEGTRVARRFLIVDLVRAPIPLMVAVLPALALGGVFSAAIHDGWVSILRAYSRDAIRQLANAANARIELSFQRKGTLDFIVARRTAPNEVGAQ